MNFECLVNLQPRKWQDLDIHLSQLKDSNPVAYVAYVSLLIEDYDDEFTVDLTGRLTVEGRAVGQHFVMRYDEKCTAMDGPWQMVTCSRVL
jgi:hypothetical protein